MRKTLIFCILAAFALPAGALGVEKLGITVNVDGQGYASITENYQISFISDFEFNDFKESAKRNASSLSSWQATHDFFKPHFGETAGNSIMTSSITFDEVSRTVILRYSLQEKFAALERSEQRTDFFVVPDSRLAAFNTGGTIVVPDNTRIDVMLPQNSEVDVSSLPEKVEVAGNRVSLGGIQSNSVEIRYSVLKPIAPSSNDILQGISGIYILAPVIALLLAGIYVKRQEIEKRIEDYLVEHSEIKPRGAEDELSLDLEK